MCCPGFQRWASEFIYRNSDFFDFFSVADFQLVLECRTVLEAIVDCKSKSLSFELLEICHCLYLIGGEHVY